MNRPEAEAFSPAKTEASFRQVSWPRGQDYQARPCLDLRLDDLESSSLVFLRVASIDGQTRAEKKSPCPRLCAQQGETSITRLP